METATSLFPPGSFEPHGQCFLWNSDLVLLHAISDSITAFAYYSIPIALLYFVKKRQDLPHKWIFVLFGAFILACGTTHVLAVWTIWKPAYWLEGAMKGVTAAFSLATAGLLWPMMPRLLRVPSPAQWEATNQKLRSEIVVRQQAEAELLAIQQDLERQVRERTAALSQANEFLRADITERKRAEAALLRQKDFYNTLSQTNQAIVRCPDREKLFSEICRIAVVHGRFRFAWIGLLSTDGQRVEPVAEYGEDPGNVEQVRVSAASTDARGQGPISEALHNGRHAISNDFLNDPATSSWHETARRTGVRSSGAFPIRLHGAVIGSINLYGGEPDFFTKDLLPTLDEMAIDVSFALANYARMEALRRSEERFKTMFDQAPLGIALIDSLTGHIDAVNAMFAKIAGRTMEEMTHVDWMSITHPDDVQKDLDSMAMLNAGKIPGFKMEKRYRLPTGAAVWINMTIAPMKVEDPTHPRHLCMIENITERKMMEAQAKRTERLAALGQLLGGIAHELKNPLFVVTGRLQIIKEKLASREYAALGEDIQRVEEAARRMATTTQRFLSLSRPTVPHWSNCSIRTILDSLLEFLGNELMKSSVRVVTSFAPDLPEIWADPQQLYEVFLNLTMNAMQAMTAAYGKGTLTIATAVEKGWLVVRLQDDGPGIAPEHMTKLFEPFFSTKPPEEGTGLGLWTVRSTLEGLNGTVNCESAEGQGVTFIVRIPIPSDSTKK